MHVSFACCHTKERPRRVFSGKANDLIPDRLNGEKVRYLIPREINIRCTGTGSTAERDLVSLKFVLDLVEALVR